MSPFSQLSESSPPNSPYKLSVTSSSDSISSSGADTTSSSGVNTVKSVSPDGAGGEDDDNSSEVQFRTEKNISYIDNQINLVRTSENLAFTGSLSLLKEDNVAQE